MNYIFCIPNSFNYTGNLKKLNYFSYLTILGWIWGVPVSHICTIISHVTVLGLKLFFVLFAFRYWKNEWHPVFVLINHLCFNHTGLETNHQPPGNHWLLGENNIFLSWLVGGCWRFLAVSCLAATRHCFLFEGKQSGFLHTFPVAYTSLLPVSPRDCHQPPEPLFNQSDTPGIYLFP